MRYGWSIEREPWAKLSNFRLNGNRWRSVQFTLSDSVTVPSTPGIYAFCALPPGTIRRNRRLSANNLFVHLFTAVYIGQTINLRRRFVQHCKQPKREIKEIRQLFAEGLEFWFCRLDLSEIEAAELLMIDCFGPPGNRQRGHISVNVFPPESADSGWPKT